MKQFAYIKGLVIVLFIALVAVVWVPSAVASKLVYTGSFGTTAIKGYDPVAYFTEGKAVKGSKAFTYAYKGATWRFATAEHRDLFAATPTKYEPQYGGWCAYAMADGKKVKIDPNAWQIHDGKLYLNYNAKIQNIWISERAKRIADADANWNQMVADAQN